MTRTTAHPEIEKVLALSVEERIAWLKQDRWFGYARANQVLDKLDDLVTHPRVHRMPSMLVISRTNNGKTHLAKRFVSKYPVDENLNGNHIVAPVLFVESPPKPTEDGLYRNILSTLYERIPTASTDARRDRVYEVLKEIQLKVLVIDELHNMLAGSSVNQQTYKNVIKSLSNKLQISIVGVGTADLLNAIHTDTQLENRFSPEILPLWSLNKEFGQLMMSFEAVLPLREDSHLASKELASLIFNLTEGTIGEMSKLLNSACEYALTSNEEKISVGTLRQCGYTPPSQRAELIKLV